MRLRAYATYDNFDLRVRCANGFHQAGVRIKDGLGVALANVHVVGSKHELDNVWLRVADPASNIVPRNIIDLVPRVTFVVCVKPGWFLTIGL
jgi:hypothetical protein